ncbi:recombinase family protein [Nocardia cyriacigeorgica]|uniref:recombinase family protein n=1 Tax=Nocardia cyriacigeorgica TaxID=135487 RepID=UPI001895148F|nr:recombinase family protein [Nocardia cyriacigeorgica]MBF6287146.1 recombinase family protein [Nocardia cyriacigeorgica]
MTPRTVKALVGARVSHVQGPEKTSHQTQRTKGDAYAEAQDWPVVGYFEDLDVSAIKLSPWERPDLKKWLTDRQGEWDALIFTKTDRVFRSAGDCVDLARWCKKQGKILVLIDDGIKLDYFHPEDSKDAFASAMSEVFLILAAVFAEIEGKRFVQRANDRVTALLPTERWGYGVPPFGFKAVDNPTGKGKVLDFDEDTRPIVQDMAARLLNGKTPTRICSEFTDEGILSPMDWVRKRAGKKIEGTGWYAGKVVSILSNPTTQGVKTYKGKPVLDSQGVAIRVGPQMFDNETWAQIQAALSLRKSSGSSRRHSTNPMLNIVKCAVCRKNLGQRSIKSSSGTTFRYFQCQNKPRPCRNVGIRAEVAEQLVEETFLELHANRRVYVQTWQPGSDHSHELEQIKQTIADLREDRAMGLFTTEEDQEMYRSQMTSLVARRDLLAAQPFTRAGWVTTETNQTYGEAWPESTPEEKRKMLVDAGVRLWVRSKNDWDIEVDLDRVLGAGPRGEELLPGAEPI